MEHISLPAEVLEFEIREETLEELLQEGLAREQEQVRATCTTISRPESPAIILPVKIETRVKVSRGIKKTNRRTTKIHHGFIAYIPETKTKWVNVKFGENEFSEFNQ